MVKRLQILLVLLSLVMQAKADPIDSLEHAMSRNPIVQEKVYLHLDNTCYFVGDTIWYKAYVVRADNFKPTDMSRLLYVELLTPDGYLVERQHIIVNGYGEACGQFSLADSLYSGYYELRAYTLWQLNFNVKERKHTHWDNEHFYTRQLAEDYYREFPGLYSRVIPVYEASHPPVYEKYIQQRKKRQTQGKGGSVTMSFYPEGGSLVKGVASRVAFEMTDEEGKPIEAEGTLSDGTPFHTEIDGRGTFVIQSVGERIQAEFKYNGKDLSFDLPEVADRGCVLSYDTESQEVAITTSGIKAAALAVVCRGHLSGFTRLRNTRDTIINLHDFHMPTGVNEIVVYDSLAQPMAARQVFVNTHGKDFRVNLKVSVQDKDNGGDSLFIPYGQKTVQVEFPSEVQGGFSLSVRDDTTDEPSFDDGGLAAELLLGGDLKGFVAHPAYYFEQDDSAHRHHLDLLMMVQGWSKYTSPSTMRYQAEKTLTYIGRVYRMVQVGETTLRYRSGRYTLPVKRGGKNRQDSKDDVLAEAELEVCGHSFGLTTPVDDNGSFSFQIPPFYGKAVLFVTAYKAKDSVDYALTSRKNKYFALAEFSPEYYVRRHLPFPMFVQQYSWFQDHQPEVELLPHARKEDNGEGRLDEIHYLDEVLVKGRRKRGMREFNYDNPAIVGDIYDMYNHVEDLGLSNDIMDFSAFPEQLTYALFGNMNSGQRLKVRAQYERKVFYRSSSTIENSSIPCRLKGGKDYTISFQRIGGVRVYTDFDKRSGEGMNFGNSTQPDVQYVFERLPDDAKRYVYSSRRYIIDGIAQPRKFYSPDYSKAKPEKPADYRRTLYWNPNVRPDKSGHFEARFFTGARPCKVKASFCGIDVNGHVYDGK